MILNTSVILAILFQEKEAPEFIRQIRSEHFVGVGSPTLVEASIVLGCRLGFETLEIA